MSRVAIDLTGKKFGRLTAIEDVGSNARKDRLWRFCCDCGNEVIEPVTLVVRGKVLSYHAKFYADGYAYIISDVGEIYGPSGKLAQHRDNKGYVRFKRKPVHRLVALNFVPGYFDGAEVDHINSARDDNRKENLRWVTPSENKAYARDSIIAANKARAKSSEKRAS